MGFVTITHPHHPLHGQTAEVIRIRRGVDPDLIVRTGGDTRTANFLVWQSAYSEFVFTDVCWPAFGRDDLFAAVAEYQRRERRFGAVDPL